MKNLFKIAAAFGLAFALSSCGTASDIYGNNYPNTRYPNSNTRYPNNGVYRSNDGNVYRQGEIYRDRNGNIYQNGRIVRRSDVYGRPGVISRDGRNVYTSNSRRIPPGQAKKIYGGNARDYARGQNNKKVTQRYPSKKSDKRFDDRYDYKKEKFKKGKKDGRR